MDDSRNRHYLVVFYMLGFFCGILYANFIARSYITMTGIFHEYFLNQYSQMKIENTDYLCYLFRWRLSPFAMLAFAGFTRAKKAAAVGCLLWTGFSAGVLAVAAVLRMGAGGMILCLIGLFPQLFFYIAGYMVLLWYLYSYPRTQWNTGKTFFVIVMMVSGMLTEAYLNPGIVRWFMKIIV